MINNTVQLNKKKTTTKECNRHTVHCLAYISQCYITALLSLIKYIVNTYFSSELSIRIIVAKNLNTPAQLLSRCPAVTSDENPSSPSDPVCIKERRVDRSDVAKEQYRGRSL